MSKEVQISFGSPLHLILDVRDSEPPAGLFAVFTFTVGNFIFTGGTMAGEGKGRAVSPAQASATMQVGSRATLSVSWRDAGGNSVMVDGPTVWVSSDPSVCQVTVATGNPLIANLLAPGPIGNASIQATADADLGEGKKSVTATIAITVISGEAVGGEITFSPTPGASSQRK